MKSVMYGFFISPDYCTKDGDQCLCIKDPHHYLPQKKPLVMVRYCCGVVAALNVGYKAAVCREPTRNRVACLQ